MSEQGSVMAASKLKVLKREKDSIEIELVGEDHTIANLIAKYAIHKKGVVYSSYIVSHPLIGNPVVVLSTDGSRDPIDILEEVLNDIIKDAQEFSAKLREVVDNNGICKEGS